MLIVVSIQVSAQPCAVENLSKQKANWISGRPNPTNYVAPADLARQQTIINNIIQPVQKKYIPRGVDVEFNSAYIQRTRLPQHINSGNYYTVDFTFAKHDCRYDRKQIMKKNSQGHGTFIRYGFT